MVRYAPDHKEKTRAAIVAATAARIRSGGLEGVGVASIMETCGLTHGGFYAHFKSRDALLAAAIEAMFATATDAVGRFEEKHGDKALERYVDFYLSARHRDDCVGGCPVPVISAEVQRAAPVVKVAFETGLNKLADRLAKIMGPSAGRKGALALLGEMAGVLNLSRVVGDAKASGELLAGARKAVGV